MFFSLVLFSAKMTSATTEPFQENVDNSIEFCDICGGKPHYVFGNGTCTDVAGSAIVFSVTANCSGLTGLDKCSSWAGVHTTEEDVECCVNADCDDGEPCTTDSCNISHNCSHTQIPNCGWALYYRWDMASSCPSFTDKCASGYDTRAECEGSNSYSQALVDPCFIGVMCVPDSNCASPSVPVSPPTLTFNVSPLSVTLGQSFDISYTVGNDAISCTASVTLGGGTGTEWTGWMPASNGTHSGYSATPITTGDKSYTISCSNLGGTTELTYERGVDPASVPTYECIAVPCDPNNCDDDKEAQCYENGAITSNEYLCNPTNPTNGCDKDDRICTCSSTPPAGNWKEVTP
ncbi:MAG: hypothetical protein A2271_02150 [Candidatus Moranbacteria bacterium RIFOXYA12_FULL_35_19]|nr:MAG: hypothetical protein A2489_03400 [Candidatus Moranbacteria bacterium RIFOXYC12_FULL_36_13]OGI36073.1 MAG: hypothetical protein A2271_02150 [Candidatus Moranbacteria bacterium RIFOXYA12_FULL_35_19]